MVQRILSVIKKHDAPLLAEYSHILVSTILVHNQDAEGAAAKVRTNLAEYLEKGIVK